MSRILIFSSQYQGHYGATASMIQLVKVLMKNHDCTVVTTGNGRLTDILSGEGIPFHIVHLGRHANVVGRFARRYGLRQMLRTALELILFQIRFYRYARRTGFDIIYANNQGGFFRIYPAVAFLRKPMITYIRSVVQNDFVTRLCIRRCYRIITIANGLLDALPPRFLERHRTKCQTIHTGFDFDRLSNEITIPDIDRTKVKIGYIGSICARKGFDFLVRNLMSDQFPRDRIQLVIAGKPIAGSEIYFEKWKKHLGDSGVKVLDLGYREDVHPVYKSIDVFVLPSLAEGLPRSLIEAMGHGVPGIANNVGGVREIIRDGVDGFLTNTGDFDMWKDRLNTLIENPNLRMRMGVAAKERVSTEFSLLKFTDRLEEAFSFD